LAADAVLKNAMKAKMLKISLLLPNLFHVRGAQVAVAAPAALPRCGSNKPRAIVAAKQFSK